MDVASEVDLHVTAMIPDDYLPDVHQRLMLYKRIAQARNGKALEDLQVEMIDRFGLLPEPVKSLFAAAEVRLAARNLGMQKLEIGPAGGRVTFRARPEVNMAELMKMIQKESHTFKLPAPDKLRIDGEFETLDDRLAMARELIERLTPESDRVHSAA